MEPSAAEEAVAAAESAGLTCKAEVMLEEGDEGMPAWLTIAEEPFTSGYVFDGEAEQHDDY